MCAWVLSRVHQPFEVSLHQLQLFLPVTTLSIQSPIPAAVTICPTRFNLQQLAATCLLAHVVSATSRTHDLAHTLMGSTQLMTVTLTVS
jgi:hypothetical protein